MNLWEEEDAKLRDLVIEALKDVAPNEVLETPATKDDFYARYVEGEFGNRPRTWPDWDFLKASGYHGRVTIRDMVAGGMCHYGVNVLDLLNNVYPTGCTSLTGKRFNEAMPDEYLTIQGNVWLGPNLLLDYSCEPNIGHRQAIRQPYLRQTEGTKALTLLKHFMDWSSYDDLEDMINLYPNATIEFSTYSKCVGILPHRNTVFWECRAY